MQPIFNRRRLVVGSVALLCGVVVLLAFCVRHSSDRALVELFTNNESLFNEGAQIMARHPDVFNVGATVILSSTHGAPIDVAAHPADYREIFTASEWYTIRNIIRQLHLDGGIKTYAGVIYFVVDKVSIWNGDSEKGIVYSERPLGPLVQRLDGRRFDPHVVYKTVRSKWYLYLGFG